MDTSFTNELQQLQMELRAQNFDIIRFSTYRIACKLRFIQRKLNFHLLDLLNIIESLRECFTSLSSESSSNTINHHISNNNPCLSKNHLKIILTSIYTNLNKRLPLSQQILHIDNCVHSAIAWFIYVYNTDQFSIPFNSFRVVLVLLCTGKLIDKMRHLFTYYFSISSAKVLNYGQIDELLHGILALPYALQEISYVTYRKSYAQLIFSHLSSSINFDDFLCTILYNNNTTPNCLQWLIIFHRLLSVENVIHRIKCSACQRASFSGFRYKCQQCSNRTYQLCQDCFWRGRTSDQHLSTHEMKEYTLSNKHIRHFIPKSFQSKRNQLSSSLTIDQEQQLSPHFIRIDTLKLINNNLNEINVDEDTQITPYVKQFLLIDEKEKTNKSKIQSQIKFPTYSRIEHIDQKKAEKTFIISKLEAKNRNILHEINTIRAKITRGSLDTLSIFEHGNTEALPDRHDISSSQLHSHNHIHKMKSADSVATATYFEQEFQTLLADKYHLESRIDHLEQNKEDLTTQLDTIGQLYRYSPKFQQRSITPSSRTRSSLSSSQMNQHSFQSFSTPPTPIHRRQIHH